MRDSAHLTADEVNGGIWAEQRWRAAGEGGVVRGGGL